MRVPKFLTLFDEISGKKNGVAPFCGLLTNLQTQPTSECWQADMDCAMWQTPVPLSKWALAMRLDMALGHGHQPYTTTTKELWCHQEVF